MLQRNFIESRISDKNTRILSLNLQSDGLVERFNQSTYHFSLKVLTLTNKIGQKLRRPDKHQRKEKSSKKYKESIQPKEHTEEPKSVGTDAK